MAKTLTIEMPDDLAECAEREGLWNSAKIADLVTAEIRRRAFERFDEMREKLQDSAEPPMSMEEIQEVIDEVRAERRAERARRP